MGTDPSVVRSIAVTVADVLDAFAARRQRGVPTVLRVTPPFSARMRARLHVADRNASTGAIHVLPATLLEDEVVEGYPTPDATADRLRAREDREYSTGRHRSYHSSAVAAWRRRARDGIRGRATLETTGGDVEVAVTALG